MQKLSNKHLRTMVKHFIKEINSISKKNFDKSVKISDFDALITHINNIQNNAKKKHQTYFSNELTLANLFVLCLSTVSLSLHSDEYDEEIFPKDWLSSNPYPNPNFILSNLLLQLTNYTLAIIDLVEKGLDSPAKALARTISELSSQTLILIYFRDDFKEYVKGTDDKLSTEIWYKLFAKNKIHKKLSIIEKETETDKELIEYMYNFRKEEYEFFSESIHHSYISVNLGSYAWQCGNDENAQKSLFGGENSSIKRTLSFLNTTLFFFIVNLFKIIDKPKNPDKLFWLEAYSLYSSIKESYLITTYPNEYTNKTKK